MCSRLSRSQGTTLIETCLAVAIVGVLAVMAIPAFDRARDSYGLTAVAHHVRSELNRARILAITRHEDCRVRATSPVTYLVECQTPEWVPIQFHELPTGFTITANNSPEFHPLGNVAPMATISVWNESGEQRRLIVSRSGRIRME